MSTEIEKLDHTEWYSMVPRSIAKFTFYGVLLMLITFGGFGLWAFTAPLAAAVISQGTFVATGQNKIVQHLEGGIIKELLVSEGDAIEVGQPLLTLDETAATANERQFRLRMARLEAIRARLLAESQEREISFPAHLNLQTEDPEIRTILESQVLNFKGSKRKLESDLQLLKSNIDALRFRASGYDQQRSAVSSQLSILREDYASKRTLLKKGFVRKPEINAIRRAIAEAKGQIGRLAAQSSETTAQVEKLERQIFQTRESYKQAALDESQSIEAELEAVREKSSNAKSILQRATIHAPVSGTIIRMHYHTAGGVIESGKSIAEILPNGVPLIIEIQIPRADIDSVRVGQNAMVRLTALNQRTTPVLDGKVFYVSADSLPNKSNIDEKEIYVARVSLSASQIKRVPGFSPTPGMPTEIMIQTASRTFFDYLSKPVSDSMSRAFKER